MHENREAGRDLETERGQMKQQKGKETERQGGKKS
jgi:hypothetical protein